MCGRFTLTNSPQAVADYFALADVPVFAPRFNIAPTQEIAAVRETAPGERELASLRWGLVPHWTKDPANARLMINARSETAASKPSFRQALARRRCLVPASGFYEWKKAKDGPKQPYHFHPPDAGIFAIAGLFEEWHGRGGEIIESVTLLTSEANALVRDVHDRMPVILAPDDFALWLDADTRDADAVAHLLVPCPPDRLIATAVSSKVNNARFDAPECVEALT
jgi:putative SOS response-associated peptidase YedK